MNTSIISGHKPKTPDSVKFTSQCISALNWFYGLPKQLQYAEWENFNRRNRPNLQYDFEQYCLSFTRIRDQWIYRGSPEI